HAIVVELLHDIDRGIGARVIANDDLDVRRRLGQNAVDRLADVARVVEVRDQYGQGGRHGVLHGQSWAAARKRGTSVVVTRSGIAPTFCTTSVALASRCG